MWRTTSFLVPMSPTTIFVSSKCVFICTINTMIFQEEEANSTIFIPSPRAYSKHNSPDIYGIRQKILKLLSNFPYFLKMQLNQKRRAHVAIPPLKSINYKRHTISCNFNLLLTLRECCKYMIYCLFCFVQTFCFHT